MVGSYLFCFIFLFCVVFGFVGFVVLFWFCKMIFIIIGINTSIFLLECHYAAVILLVLFSLETFKDCKKKSVIIFTFVFCDSIKTNNTFILIQEKELTSSLV